MPGDPKMKPQPIGKSSWAHRVGWLILIWTSSVLALGVAAGLMRLLMTQAGLTG